MAKLILPKATTAAREAAIPVAGEILFDNDQKQIYFGNGVTQGGVKLYPGSLGDAFVYGVDRDESYSSPTEGMQKVILNNDAGSYTPVSNFTHMPAHNLKRCVMSDLSDRTVAYYLNAGNSNYKADGTAADLTGTDGDVMVEIPIGYYRIDTYLDGDHRHTVKLISDKPFPGSAPFPAFYVSDGGETLQKQYIGAFKASVDANSKCRSIAGVKPTVSKTRAQFRTAAVSNGGTLANTLLKMWIGWLAEIEFASTNVQTSISKGFSEMSAYDASYLRYCGRTAALGNGTGQIIADTEDADSDLEGHWADGASKVVSFSYRGIEDPWGACWEFDDGIQKYQDDVSGDYTKSGYWFTSDTSKYTLLDSDNGYGPVNTPFPAAGNTGANTAWVSHAWPKSTGYIKAYDPLTYFPTDDTGSSTTYLCDFLYNTATAGARVVFRGGLLDNSTFGGAFCVNVHNELANSSASLGGRLAC